MCICIYIYSLSEVQVQHSIINNKCWLASELRLFSFSDSPRVSVCARC